MAITQMLRYGAIGVTGLRVLLTLSLLAAAAASGGATPVDECDGLAANPYDPVKRAAGVLWRDLDAVRAVAACRAALDRAPNDPGYQFQYARALHKAGRYEDAAAWYQMAARQGYAAAQRNLGVLYAVGDGVAEDDARAVALFRMAAEAGSAAGQASLGIMYAEGNGVARDDDQAVTWYRLAAAQGLPSGQNNLGLMYAEGRGVARDDAAAARWFLAAAAQDHPRAQINLAVLYMTGRGVPWDPLEAVAWFFAGLANMAREM